MNMMDRSAISCKKYQGNSMSLCHKTTTKIQQYKYKGADLNKKQMGKKITHSFQYTQNSIIKKIQYLFMIIIN